MSHSVFYKQLNNLDKILATEHDSPEKNAGRENDQ